MKPVILLAFANELVKGRFLKNLSNEQNEIRKALEKAEDNALCELVILSNATLESLTETFQRKKYRDRIAVFHYAGHAASYKLLLEGKGGETAEAHSSGLVPFLASQNGLKLVFLNGCNSERQAQDMINAGVPMTVGTVEAVNDKVATDLAARFYNALGEGAGIKQAWDQATYIQQSQKGNQDLSQYYSTRSIELLDEEPDRFPWQIYTRPGSEDVLNWNLPEAADNPYFGLPDLSKRFDLPEDPYHFLERYQRKDARVFFGRGAYIRDIHQRLSSPFSAPCLLFYGQSGVGKSSLLEAGLFPRLETDYEIQCIRRDPETGLLAHLKEALGAGSNFLDAWKKQEQNSNKKGFILILDQVEEVYTRPREEEKEELNTFLKEAAQIFSNPQDRPKGKLVLAYRKEYDSEIEKACREVSLAKEKIFLDRLGRNGIMEVVKGLTSTTALQNKYSVKIEEELPVVIADDLLVDRDSPISPVLQIIMTRLWQEDIDKTQRNFTVADYNELRQKGILLDDFFHQQMKELQAWEKHHQTNVVSSGLALDILKYHTTQLTTAASRNLEELKSLYSNRKDILEPLLQKMSDLYLLANIDNQKSILAHDTLAPIVRRELNDSDKPGQRALRILQSKGLDYKIDPKGTYIDEADLKIVEDGADGTHAWTESEKALIEQSRKRRERLAAKRKRTNRIQFAGIVGIALLGAIATIFGIRANKQAKVNEKIAEASRVERTDATRALNIISEALEIDPEDKNALQTRHDIFSENEFHLLQFNIPSDEISDQDFRIDDVALSDNGNLIAAAASNKIFLWNKEGKSLQVFPHSGKINAIQFTQNDQAIISFGDSKVIQLWDINGAPIQSFKGHNDFLETGIISNDEKLILSGGSGGTVYLWNAKGEILDSINAHEGLVTTLAINATNDTLYTGGDDDVLNVWHWDGESIEKINSIYHKARILSVDYHKNSTSIVAAYRDGTVKIMSRGGVILKEIKAHNQRINQVEFSPDGKYFLTAGKDAQIKLWSIEGNLIKTYQGHDHFVHAVDFDLDGEYFVSADETGRIIYWKRNSKVDRSYHIGNWSINCTAFSPDKSTLLIGAGILNFDSDKEEEYTAAAANCTTKFPVWLMNIESGEFKQIGNHCDEVMDVAFSPDGQFFCSSSRSGTTTIWNINGEKIKDIQISEKNSAYEALFIEDGLITIEEDFNTSKIYVHNQNWELDQTIDFPAWINDIAISGQLHLAITDYEEKNGSLMGLKEGQLNPFLENLPPLRSIQFSTDGKYLACGEYGTTAGIQLFDAKYQRLNQDWPMAFKIDNKEGGRGVNALEFSNFEDSRYLLAGAEGGFVTVFDLELDGQEIFSFNDFEGKSITGLHFLKGGNSIIVASADGYIRIYPNLIKDKPNFFNQTNK